MNLSLNISALTSKKMAAVGAAILVATTATSAFAIGGLGDVVFDPSNYAQAIKQVQAWEQQYSQMAQSIQKAEATLAQAKSQVQALTGNRGFGDLLNNPALRRIIPPDLSSTLSGLNSTGVLSGKALQIRNASAVYNCQDITSAAAQRSCQVLLGQNAQAQAIQQDTMGLLNQRTTQIEALRAEISATQDPKAIAELQARLEAEQAQVANDQNKIVTANAMIVANQQAAAQAEAERVNALMASDKPDVLSNFDFTNAGYASTHVAAADQ
jgi:type IV secretion system protein VirB5